MREEQQASLWVVKFCLKVIFPKYNLYLFLVYLAVKSRLEQRRQGAVAPWGMARLRSLPAHLHQQLVRTSFKDSACSTAYFDCLVVPYETYLRLASENPFYLDKSAVWVSVHLSLDLKERCKMKHDVFDKTKSMRFDLNRMKSEIHRKLWNSDQYKNYDKERIVRVVGSKRITDGVIIATENEEYNIRSCFGLVLEDDNVEIQVKSVRYMDHVPQIATSAAVEMILNQFDLSNDFVTELLNNHFKLPKLVHINDIISIDLTKEMTTKYHYKYLDLIGSTRKIYFRCCKINCGVDKIQEVDVNKDNCVQLPYFIVRGKTELHLGESIHSIMPAHRYVSLENARDCDMLVDTCPFGLKKYFSSIQEAILPFLVDRQSNPMHSAVSAPIMPMFLLTGPRGSGRHLLVKTLASYNGMNCLVVDCNSVQSTTAKQTESKISSLIQKAKASSPVIVLMDNFEVFAVDAENNEDCRVLEYFHKMTTTLFDHYTKQPIIFIAVTEKSELKPNIIRLFLEKNVITRASKEERRLMLEWFVSVMGLEFLESDDPTGSTAQTCDKINLFNSSDPQLNETAAEAIQRISAKTETFLYGDLDTLVHFALRNSYMKQHEKMLEHEPILQRVKEEDFSSAVESMRALQSQHMDAPKIPKVYWEDIGGLDKLKRELLKTIEFPIKYPHLFKNSSLKRSGVLLYGPPGCGKTLVAKALSTELNVSFLSVKGPELLNMYIGQSEENVRKVFESARASSPCVVFLDELDALAPRRGAAGDSGGASDRVVSQLLAEIDGVTESEGAESTSFVFIMGATNRPDLLEPSLLRPGRLDKLIYVGPYSGLREKTKVMKALCRSHRIAEDVSLEEICAALPDRCTGADLLQVVSVARSVAVRNTVQRLHAGDLKESELNSESLVLGMPELRQGVRDFRPSTTDEEFLYYESLQGQM